MTVMSASNSIKIKTTCNHWLWFSLFVIFGTSVQANDGLKPITPNTSSVTAGSSSGAASATSSVGGYATYNSGVDWSKASSIPWKGINWGASGTIPRDRIPKLSTSQIPTLTQAQLPNAFPSKWATQLNSAPQGTLCGWVQTERTGNNNDHYSIKFSMNCNNKAIHQKKGTRYYAKCPSGYNQFYLDADNFSCYKL